MGWNEQPAAEGDEGLIGGVVPLDGGLDLGPEFLSLEKGVEDADAVEIEAVGVGGEMLKEFRKGFGGGEAPEVFFPGGNQLADFLIGLEGVLEAGTDMTSVDTGDPGGVGVIGSRKISQRLGKNSRGIGTAGWLSFFHEVLQAPTKDGQDGEGSVRKEKITQDLEPDDDKFYGVLPLKGLGIANEREGAAGGEGLMKGVIRLDLPQGCFEASRQAGKFVPGPVADAEDDNAGREPGSVPPLGVGFGVEAEVYPEINVGNDGSADLTVPGLGGPNLF